MAKYDLNTITAAFTMMGRLVNAEKPVVFTKLGLNTTSCTLFKEAVTHSFKDGEGNEVLKRLFIANEDDGTYHFNTSVSPDYRIDPMLPSRIADAMAIVGRKKRKEAAERKIAAAPAVPEQSVEQSAVEATIEQSVPKWMNVPAPEGPLESVEGPDLTRLTDGQLNMLKWHIATEENRRRFEAKKAELLKVFSEMAKEEGFSLEDLM